MKPKAIILLSGGLDSITSLAVLNEDFDIKLALTFDYGQKAAKKEIQYSKNIADFYNIEHKLIELNWLKEITNTALVNDKTDLPMPKDEELDNFDEAIKSAKGVWVPNRNGLLLNIAGSYADSMGLDYIIFGANKEEGTTFPDNTQEFIDNINKSLEFSTLKQPKVIAPLIKLDKKEIVRLAKENDVPFKHLRSCYLAEEKHCGECESCKRLKRALLENGYDNIYKALF